MNECDTPELFCGNKAKCKNTLGGYDCECFDGYEKVGNASTCVDVNECLLSPCDSAAICTNLDGTFQCKCIEGFVGNGLECRGMLVKLIYMFVLETILFPTNRQDHVLPHMTNAVLPYRLHYPLKIFGKEYDMAFVSNRLRFLYCFL